LGVTHYELPNVENKSDENRSSRPRLLLERQLNQHLNSILGELGESQRVTAERLFKQLGEYNHKGKLVRRPCELRTAAKACGVDSDELLQVVDRFRDPQKGRTFLTPPSVRNRALREGKDKLDISHEALLRRWKTLRDWIEQESKDAEEFRTLAERANNKDRITGKQLPRFLEWSKQFSPTKPWARRYEGPIDAKFGRPRYDLPTALRYLESSRRQSWLRGALYIALVLAMVGGLVYIEMQRTQRETERAGAQERLKLQQDYNARVEKANNALSDKNREIASKDHALSASYQKLQEAKQQADADAAEARTQRNAAVSAQTVATEARARAEEQSKQAQEKNSELAELNATLKKTTEQLAQQESKLETANAEISLQTAATKSPDWNPQTTWTDLSALVAKARSYSRAASSVPPGTIAALERAFAVTRLLKSDSNAEYGPVILALAYTANEGRQGPEILALREGDSHNEDRNGNGVGPSDWASQHAAASPANSCYVVGGAGGLVVLGETDVRECGTTAFPGYPTSSGGRLFLTRKRHLFPITGVGFSTDGRWLATASSITDMKLMRVSDFFSKAPLKRAVLMIASIAKLQAFLTVNRYRGDYPIRQFAISLPKAPNSHRSQIQVMGLTEAGKLLVWTHPGPIGKQISRTNRFSVKPAGEPADLFFSAINTQPKHEVVWAGTAAGEVGKVSVAQKVFSACPEVTRSAGISVLSWDDNGTRLAVGTRDGEISVFRSSSTETAAQPVSGTVRAGSNLSSCGLEPIIRVPAHSASVTTIVWEGVLLVSGSIDGSARVWNMAFQPNEEQILQTFHELQREEQPSRGAAQQAKFDELMSELESYTSDASKHPAP
jgi:hypothetical protein